MPHLSRAGAERCQTGPVTERYTADDHACERTLLIAAAYVLLRRGEEVLLQQRSGTGYRDGWWAMLAGHVDPGESVHEAAIREAREEAGVMIAPADLHPVTTVHRFEPGGPQVEQRADFFFTATRWSGEPALCEPDKAAAMTWFAVDALPEPLVPHERRVIELVTAGGVVPPIVSLTT